MDIISGIVVATSVFMVAMALVVLFVRMPMGAGGRGAEAETRAVAQRVMATSLVVYFVAVLDLLLIAQQAGLALGTFVVGLVVLVVFYVEPALRARGTQASDESESWDK